MKKPGALIPAAVMLTGLMITVASVWAQPARRLHFSTRFDPLTVATIAGEVLRLEQVPAGSGLDYCTQAVLRTPEGDITIILAPQDYLTEKGLGLAPRDRLTVTGSFILLLNHPFLLVTEVAGDRTMKLREADGRPLWAAKDFRPVP